MTADLVAVSPPTAARVFTISVATRWLLDQLRVIAGEIGRREIPRIARNMVGDMPQTLMRHFFPDFFLHRRR